MQATRLGRTGLNVTRTSMGVLPLQRTEMEEAVRILRAARDAGITFFDTARAYTDSEEKMGRAFAGVRDSVIIATKSTAADRAGVLADLETSLRTLRTDYVDLLQIHNASTVPSPDDPESPYAALLEARRKGMARSIGITSHRRDVAEAAVDSGLFDTLQYPLCSISSEDDLALIDRCGAADMGIIAMKALSGGLLTNIRAAFAFMRQFENLVPIWGIQRMSELEEFIALDADPPVMDDELCAAIERDRAELSGGFCRACGYCLPCPANIPLPMATRMGLMLRRMPYQQFMSDQWREQMHRIENCIDCGHCREHCPYGLDVPALLASSLAEYDEFYQHYTADRPQE